MPCCEAGCATAHDLLCLATEAELVLPPLCELGFFFEAFEVQHVAPRILLVDDDPRHRRSLGLGLRAAGFSTIEADGGSAAIQVLDEQPVDLMITDLMMPGVSGLQLVRHVHASFPSLPVVLTSGYELGRKQLERAGLRVLAFVPKPYDLDALASFLRNNLARQAIG